MLKQLSKKIFFIFGIVFLAFLMLCIRSFIVFHILRIDYERENTIVGIYPVNNYNLNSIENNKKRIVSFFPLVTGFFSGQVHFHTKKNYEYYFTNGYLCIQKKEQKKIPQISFGPCEQSTTYYFKEEAQVYETLKSGVYQIELWGAGGGNSYALGNRYDRSGNGAYTKGEIYLKKGQKLYFYVGSRGEDSNLIYDDNRLTVFYYPSEGGKGGYNGGGDGASDPQTDAGGGGGGATDVRLVAGSWDDFDSLKSRIMVAAGAGGMSRHYDAEGSIKNRGDSGSGGTISGLDAKKLLDEISLYGHGATQTTGYQFGIGQNGIYCKTSLNGLGGGAGGYYGSYSGACGVEMFEMPTGAGGGSSYVSGCKGCNAIDKDSTKENLIFTNQPVHYSKMEFKNIIMKSGEEKMPTGTGKSMIGNKNNGMAKITFLHY